jgi:hypothetical protein
VDALKRPAALALTALVLVLTACGSSGDDRTKMAANLQNYLDTAAPVPGLPAGAGPPHVKKKGCKKIPKGEARPARRPLASWSCVVTVAHVPFRVLVGLKDNGDVAWALPVRRQVLGPKP